MTKDGRPSRINDIRYFVPSPTSGRAKEHLKGQDDAVAFGRRLVWFLNGEGFSCGAYTAVYLFLTPTLEPGTVKITDEGGDWWQRYTHVGVPEDFSNKPESSEIVKSGTVAALKAIRPDLTTIVDYAERIVRAQGDNLRFLMQTRQTKRYTIDLYFNIPVYPQPAYLFTSITDRSSGEVLEGPPLATGAHGAPFDYNGAIKVRQIIQSISEFVPKPRPVMSKLVRRH